jgi:hypothetical protein
MSCATTMRLPRCVPTFGLVVLMLGSGSLLGCGSSAPAGPSPEQFAAGKAITAEMREVFKKKQDEAPAKKTGGMRNGKPSVKPQP